MGLHCSPRCVCLAIVPLGGGGGEGLREVPTACACVCTQPVRVSALLHLRGRNCPNLSKEVLLKLQKF